MLYNDKEPLSSLSTAGKVTVLTTILGVVVFALVFLLNVGKKEFEQAIAQESDVASTSVVVLNTPPSWTLDAYETVASATSTPTNSGDTITWSAIATDSNLADYQLLICSTSATPTPGTSTTSPQCGAGAITWAVSTNTTSGLTASAATTTNETFPPFAERSDWYAFVCDAIDLNSRCNTSYRGHTGTATGSPFHVNRRPLFTDFWDDSPADPGANVVFTSTSSDPDTVGGSDTLQLIVCATTSYNTVTNQCDGTTLATSTLVASNATGTYTVVIPTQDQDYSAYGYIVDEHGHEALGGSQGSDSTMTINNVAPTVAAASIIINNGLDMTLVTEAGETTGFVLEFIATDNNSCENASSGEEITDYVVSLYRSGIGSTTCDGITGTYNANNCYPSDVVSTAVWNLTCTATSTANDCNFSNDDTDRTRTFSCSFPLWYVADPTDGGATNTPYFAENWLAEVRAIDDDYATGTPSESSSGKELNSLLAFTLNTLSIPYGEVEPGSDTGQLNATTSISATGNVGLDEGLEGSSMCSTYTSTSTCPASASSTIPADQQQYSTSLVNYGLGTALSSTSQQELEINVLKSTSTSTPESKLTYWGIAVPGTISLAGLYTGENIFYAVTSEPGDW